MNYLRKRDTLIALIIILGIFTGSLITHLYVFPFEENMWGVGNICIWISIFFFIWAVVLSELYDYPSMSTGLWISATCLIFCFILQGIHGHPDLIYSYYPGVTEEVTVFLMMFISLTAGFILRCTLTNKVPMEPVAGLWVATIALTVATLVALLLIANEHLPDAKIHEPQLIAAVTAGLVSSLLVKILKI